MSKLVFVYLSRCADRQGRCFPSLGSIAEGCGISKTSVKRAISELRLAGLVEVESRFAEGRANGRQTSNLYRINSARPRAGKSAGLPRAAEPPAEKQAVKREENRLPAGGQPEEALRKADDEELRAMKERFFLEGMDNEALAEAVDMALTDMWYSSFTRVRGECVPRERVRERLKKLDRESIELAAYELGNRADIGDKRAYLISCLYNAPARFAADIGAFREELAITNGRRSPLGGGE